MNYKIKILGIAPYKELLNLMKLYASTRTDVHFTAVLGSLEEGVRLAKEHYQAYDMIISRANTADMISHAVPIPVIDLGISYYDMLHAVKAAENLGKRTAFLGFHRMTTIAKTLCSLLQMQVDIFSVQTASEAEQTLRELKAAGYQAIICDTLSYNAAKLMGFAPILVMSGKESLDLAIDEAVASYRKHQTLVDYLSTLRYVLDTSEALYFIISVSGKIIYQSICDQANALVQRLCKEISACEGIEKRTFFITLSNRQYSVIAHTIDDAAEPYIIFRLICSEIPVTYSKYGITIMDKRQAEKSFMESFYSCTELARSALPEPETISALNSSIMITGEAGTGKDHFAHILYAKSRYRDNPLYVINCGLINEKSWLFLINHYNSPFTDNDNTIYIANLHLLSSKQQKQLLSIIIDSNMHIRNQLIFSCEKPYNAPLPHVAMEYANMLGSIFLPITPMREQKKDLIASAGLYIDILNQQIGKQVVGLEESAGKLLEDCDWPYNHIQFKRVLKEAVSKTEGPYISKEVIQTILRQEAAFLGASSDCKNNLPSPDAGLPFNLNKTLNEINHDIVTYVLQACNGNHTLASKKLGISRTTLWRYVNNGEPKK